MAAQRVCEKCRALLTEGQQFATVATRHDVTTTLPITVVTSACCMLPGAQVPAADEVRKAIAAVVEAQALHGSFGFQVMDLPGFSATGGLAHSC